MIARTLAPTVGIPPGALILRSDVVRKRELGVEPLTRLGSEAYVTPVSDRVYRIIAERAKAAVLAGHAAVVRLLIERGARLDMKDTIYQSK